MAEMRADLGSGECGCHSTALRLCPFQTMGVRDVCCTFRADRVAVPLHSLSHTVSPVAAPSLQLPPTLQWQSMPAPCRRCRPLMAPSLRPSTGGCACWRCLLPCWRSGRTPTLWRSRYAVMGSFLFCFCLDQDCDVGRSHCWRSGYMPTPWHSSYVIIHMMLT